MQNHDLMEKRKEKKQLNKQMRDSMYKRIIGMALVFLKYLEGAIRCLGNSLNGYITMKAFKRRKGITFKVWN